MLDILTWALVASPIVVGLGWGIVDGIVLPWLIPRAEIERLADDLMRRYPIRPEAIAFIEEHAAWCRSDGYDQGRWRRIRRVLKRWSHSWAPAGSDNPTGRGGVQADRGVIKLRVDRPTCAAANIKTEIERHRRRLTIVVTSAAPIEDDGSAT